MDQPARTAPRAVLFDRDGTLVHDVPFNGEPALVRPIDGAREAVDRLRSTDIAVGVVTHQPGVARGLLTTEDVAAVNARVEELLGPFDTWQVCPHGPRDGCACHMPTTGLVAAAARELAVPVTAVTVIGAHLADVEAGRAAGAVGVLVPRPTTARADVERAPVVAGDLAAALDLLGI